MRRHSPLKHLQCEEEEEFLFAYKDASQDDQWGYQQQSIYNII